MTKPANTANQAGFTILELLIATMVFSVIFLATTTAILQISKLYFKGVTTNRTQEATRSTIDSIAQQVQFAKPPPSSLQSQQYTVVGAPSNHLDFKAYCIGTSRYSFIINAQVDGSVAAGSYEPSSNHLRHALWRDTITDGQPCVPADLSRIDPSSTTSPPDANGSNGQELLGGGMRLSSFNIDCNAATRICLVDVGIIYGDNDLLAPDAINPTHCNTIIGNQWCASSRLSTTVLKRVGTIN